MTGIIDRSPTGWPYFGLPRPESTEEFILRDNACYAQDAADRARAEYENAWRRNRPALEDGASND